MLRFRRHSPEPRLEMTPLIDVIFLLLTFFIFALVLMVRAELLDVRLPALSAASPSEPRAVVTLAIKADGSLFVDGTPAEPARIADLIRVRRVAKPDAALLIAVDEGGRNDTLLALLNELARAGLHDFSIVGRKPAAP
jgi:biopolymer transport protein ExbD